MMVMTACVIVMDDVDGARYTTFFSLPLFAPFFLLFFFFFFSVVSSRLCFFYPNGFRGSAKRVVDGRSWGFDKVMLGQVGLI